jgi:SulP family sulfate permease
VVAGVGILEGVGVGIGLATVLFVHRYSQLSTIKTQMSGSEHMGTIDRNLEDQACLDAHGKALQIFILQGFLFFGSSTRLLEQVKNVLTDPDRAGLAYVLMDFRHVDAMDTSAANCFAKLMQWCGRDGLTLVLTGCSADMSERLTQLADDLGGNGRNVRILDDLEDGVGWCQDEILKTLQKQSDAPQDASTSSETPQDLDAKFEHLLGDLLGDPKAAKHISPIFKRVDKRKDAVLFAQGDPGDALYLVLLGSISIVLDMPGKPALTVRTMRAGAILGEMALYTGEPRSASAVARQDCVFYRLDRAGYETLQQIYPRAFGLFQCYVVRLMSERLGRANRAILALSR